MLRIGPGVCEYLASTLPAELHPHPSLVILIASKSIPQNELTAPATLRHHEYLLDSALTRHKLLPQMSLEWPSCCPDDALSFLSGFIQLCLDSNFDLALPFSHHSFQSRWNKISAPCRLTNSASKAQNFSEIKSRYLKGQPYSSRENLFPASSHL